MPHRILVTGATGFVGSHMVDFILQRQPDAHVYATRRWHLSRMDNVRHIQDRIHWTDCDLTDPVSVRAAFDKAALSELAKAKGALNSDLAKLKAKLATATAKLPKS